MTTFGNGDFSGAAQGAGNFLSNNSQGLLGLSSGLLSGQGWNQGLSQGFQGFNQGHQQDTKTQDKRKADASTQSLIDSMPGLTDAQKQAFKNNPALAQQVAARGIDNQLAPASYDTITGGDGNVYAVNKANPSDFKQVGPAGIGKSSTATDVQRNFIFAKQQGFQGNFTDYQQSLKENSNQANPLVKNAPPGTYWNDPNDPTKGVTQIPGDPTKQQQPTAENLKAANYGQRASGANANLETLIPQVMGSTQGYGTFLQNSLPNAWHSDASQQYDQAVAEFGTAVLRKDSGAVLSPEDFEKLNTSYIPQPGDGAKQLQQKADARRRAIEGLAIEANGKGQGTDSGSGFTTMPNGNRIKQIGQ